ncbi:hypothetical protein [Achromobacter sp. AONIH1]|uniref:hypothetical protein n=1 Tax=Achromobacter sp. AONIH1 TaxID=1758194 RepID=UPI000CD2F220|nr:hypothetical protein [Achromobacter sp. AONIH1]AUT48807.1 hypothetical protein C2U31_24120 [Achromobacter sp. AONIH1]
MQDLAQHALHLVDANGGIGLAWARRLRCASLPASRTAVAGRRTGILARASIAALGARTAITLSTEIAVVAAAVETGALAILAARPVLIGALAVAFIAPTGMALLATPVETAIAAIVPGVFRASLRTAVAAVVVVFTTAILLAIVTARLPAAVLASAAGIFPARILTIITGVFPASFLAARSLATAGIALPLIATISARPLATAALLAAILAGVLTMAFVFATTVLAPVAAVFAAAGARPVVPPPRRRVTARARLGMAATAAIRPRGPGGPLGTLDRGAGLALRAREERPSVAPFARLGGGRTGTRRLGFAHGVFQIRRHRSALVNAIAGLMAG